MVSFDGVLDLPKLGVELCETAGVTVQGTVVPGRSSQRVHATADIAPGHTLVISGPTGGGNRRLVVLMTPAVVPIEKAVKENVCNPGPPATMVETANAFGAPLPTLLLYNSNCVKLDAAYPALVVNVSPVMLLAVPLPLIVMVNLYMVSLVVLGQ